MRNDDAEEAGDGLIAVFPDDDHCGADQHCENVNGEEHMIRASGNCRHAAVSVRREGFVAAGGREGGGSQCL